MEESWSIIYDRPEVKESQKKAVDEHRRTSKAYVKLKDIVAKDAFAEVERKADDADTVSNVINESCSSCNKTLIGILNRQLAQAKVEYKAFNIEVTKREEKARDLQKRRQREPEIDISSEYIDREIKENERMQLEFEDIERQIQSLRDTIIESLASEKLINDEISQSQLDINLINFETRRFSDDINSALRCLEASNKEIASVVEGDKIGVIFNFSAQGCQLFSKPILANADSSIDYSSQIQPLSSVAVLIVNAREYMSLSSIVKIDLDDFYLDLSLIPLLHGPIVSLSFYNKNNPSHKYQESLLLKHRHKYSHSSSSSEGGGPDASHLLSSFFFNIMLIHSLIEMSRTNHLSHGVLQSYNAFRDFGHILLQSLLELEFNAATNDYRNSAYDYLIAILFKNSNVDADIQITDVENRLEIIFQECIRIMLS